MERMTEKQVAKKTIEKLAIVVVTYKRQQLLATLFESIEKLTVAPWRIIVVDNEHSDKTHGMVEEFSATLTAQWGTTVADLSGNENRVVYPAGICRTAMHIVSLSISSGVRMFF